MTSGPVDRLNALLDPVVKAEGCVIFGIEITGSGKYVTLRVYIDKPGGVTVEDCARVSGQVGLVIEAEDAMAGSYILEVSSPGLTRPLKKPKDWLQSLGKRAQVTLKQPMAPIRSQKFLCDVVQADDNCAKVKLEKSGELLTIPYSNIAKAKLEIDI